MDKHVPRKDIYDCYAYISNFKSGSLHLPDRDYSGPGVYHVISCAQNFEGRRAPLFEETALRKLIQTNWLDLPQRYPSTQLDEFVIMHDHIHFLIWPNKWPDRVPPGHPPYLYRIMQSYKSRVAVEWLNHIKRNEPDRSAKIWQAGYYERAVRIGELDRARKYIRENPDQFFELMDWKKPF